MLCECVFFMNFLVDKQRTAYEMRISDWRSDVGASVLPCNRPGVRRSATRRSCHRPRYSKCPRPAGPRTVQALPTRQGHPPRNRTTETMRRRACPTRSEEHTSELQSLMRISYAVFCLKKKKQQNTQHTHMRPKHQTH